MAANHIKHEIKQEMKHDMKQESSASQPPPPEYKVIVPDNRDKKRYSILQFNGPLNVDPGRWTQMKLKMAREDNRSHTTGPSEIRQEYGEGSEYGRAAREEARRKRYGRQTKTYQHDQQPWQLHLKDSNTEENGKERLFRSVREGGAGAHSDDWVFLKSGNNFHALKVDDWYRFMPDRQRKGLDIDQAEEQFLQRNKVLNQFALKAKIQQTIKDQDEDGGKLSKPVALKIKDDLSTDDEEANDEENARADKDGSDNEQRADKKKSQKKKNAANARNNKKQRVKNDDDVAAYETDDGEDEGREFDYMTDSGSNTSREELTVDEKIDQDLVAVGDETGMRDDLTDAEDEEDDEEQGDEENKQKRKLLKKLKEQKQDKPEDDQKLRIIDQVEKRESSGSDSDDPDNFDATSSAIFLPKKTLKRNHEGDEAGAEGAKRSKTASREQTPGTDAQKSSTSAAADSSEDKLDEETIRRLLSKRPLTTKELINKVRPRCQDMSKVEIVSRLVEILRAINANQIERTINKKKVVYFSVDKAT